MTQCERIIRHLEDFDSITDVEALSDYSVRRLAARICDLRKRGYDISTEMVKGVNRYDEPTRYARYRLNK